MKNALYFAFLFAANSVLAQSKNDKKIFLDSLKRETKEKNHHFYRIVKDYKTDKEEYNVITYYKSGKIEEEKTINYKEDHQGSFGIIKQFYENGNPKHQFTPYEPNDSIQSRTIDFFENGIKSSELIATHKSRKAILYEYYPDGKKKEIKTLDYQYPNTPLFSKTIEFWDKDGNKTVSDGNGRYQFEDDEKTVTGEIKEGKRVNIWSITDKRNKSTNTIHYSETGIFLKGETTLKNGEKKTYNQLETAPIPKKGYQHFGEYISKNFNYTGEAIKNRINGKIILEFVVEKDGSITEIKVVKGLGFGLDEEAVRILASYGDWYPGQQEGKSVRVRFSIPITINLK